MPQLCEGKTQGFLTKVFQLQYSRPSAFAGVTFTVFIISRLAPPPPSFFPPIMLLGHIHAPTQSTQHVPVLALGGVLQELYTTGFGLSCHCRWCTISNGTVGTLFQMVPLAQCFKWHHWHCFKWRQWCAILSDTTGETL